MGVGSSPLAVENRRVAGGASRRGVLAVARVPPFRRRAVFFSAGVDRARPPDRRTGAARSRANDATRGGAMTSNALLFSAIVLAFALVVTTHVLIVAGLLVRRPRWH